MGNTTEIWDKIFASANERILILDLSLIHI